MRFLAVLLLASCAELSEPVPDADAFVGSLVQTPDGLPLTQAPPPAWIPTFEVGPIYAGESTEVLVTGVPQGAQVYLLKSEAGPGAGACHPQFPICAGLRNPMAVVASGVAGPSGEVGMLFNAGPNAVAPHWFQAAITHRGTNTARVTSVLVRVPGDADGDFILDALDNCPAEPNGPQIDQDADGFGLPCDCMDGNATVFPGGTEIPGNGIDDDCVGGDESAWPGHYTGSIVVETGFPFGGDCIGTMSIDVPVGTGPIIGLGECDAPFLGTIQFEVMGNMSGPDSASGIFNGGFDTMDWQGNFQLLAGQARLTGVAFGVMFGVPADGTFDLAR